SDVEHRSNALMHVSMAILTVAAAGDIAANLGGVELMDLGGSAGSLTDSLVSEAGAGRSGDTVSLWRSVKVEELADIEATGGFRNLGSAEGKYFSQTPEGAASYAKQAYGAWPHEGPYSLVRTEISRSALTPEMAATVDRGIPAVVVPD